jgi:methyltransferase-like protein/SAM-dependent methyltransferase
MIATSYRFAIRQHCTPKLLQRANAHETIRIGMDNPYNQVPYPSLSFPQAHLNRLATNAVLYGLNPPDIASCRVLELGCGDGTHLIPMALQFPGSLFVGIDAADMPIARASATAAELGLENISFRVADVAQLSGQPKECDYLITHGLYSWVPPQVQSKIMELCGRLLAPSGVAYVSYNTYPAWRIREMTREMIRMHTAGITDPVEIRNKGVTLLAAIYRAQGEREPYRETIRAEMERIIAKDAPLCFHDDLGDYNLPVYFSEFIRRAAAEGLQFLSEADPPSYSELPPDIVEGLGQVADPVEREQQYDFLTLRGFRRTLLCRDDLVVDREVSSERLRKLHYAAAIRTVDGPPDLATFAPSEFVSQSGASISVNQPFVKAVLHRLERAWPATLNFDELTEGARAVAPLLSATEATEMVREVLLRMHTAGLLEMSVLPWAYPARPSERPSVSRFARLQSRNGHRVTSLRHRPVDLDDENAKALLPLADGTHDRDQLRSELARLHDREVTAEEIEGALTRLNEVSLLES